MLQGKNLILATKAFTTENRTYSWFCLFQALALLILCVLLSLYAPYWPLRVLFGCFQGAIIVRLFVIYHDYEHHAILQKSYCAKIIMKSLGIFMLAPESIWKRSHDFHHQQNSKLWTASIGSYPVLTKQKFSSYSAKEQRRYLRTRHPLSMLAGYLTMFFIGMCWRAFQSDASRHRDALVAMVFHIVYIFTVFFLLGWQAVITGILLPFTLTGIVGSYLFFVQHNFPDVNFQSNADWTYEKAALQSSSYMKMNPVMAWITANIGYHHIHHLNSHIPFYRLPEVMRAFPELQKVGCTSWKIKDVIACLKLKVWDEENEKMIGESSLRKQRPYKHWRYLFLFKKYKV